MGQKQKALDYYNKLINFMEANKDFDEESITWVKVKINELNMNKA